jgi:Flp pilus assembly pilin Flp
MGNHVSAHKETTRMTFITRALVRLRESLHGQTMAEYTFILAAVAIAVFVTYEVLGQDLSSMVNKVGPEILGAS